MAAYFVVIYRKICMSVCAIRTIQLSMFKPKPFAWLLIYFFVSCLFRFRVTEADVAH